MEEKGPWGNRNEGHLASASPSLSAPTIKTSFYQTLQMQSLQVYSFYAGKSETVNFVLTIEVLSSHPPPLFTWCVFGVDV